MLARSFRLFIALGYSVFFLSAQKSLADPLVRPQSTFEVVPESTTIDNNELWVLVDLSDRLLTLMRGTQVMSHYPVGVGKADWETPTGNFRIIELVHNPMWEHPFTGEIFSADDPGNPIQDYWIAFHVGEDGLWYGMHGTNQPNTVGTASSHGCLRMYTDDVAVLFAKLRYGTLVQVNP